LPDDIATHEITITSSSCRESELNKDKEFVCWLLSFFGQRLVLGWDRVYRNPTNVVNGCLISNRSNLEKVLKHFLERYDCAYFKEVRSKYFDRNPKEEYEEQAILRAILYQHARHYDHFTDWIHAAIAFMEYDNLKMVLANHASNYKLDGKELFKKILKSKKNEIKSEKDGKHLLEKAEKADKFRKLRNEFLHRGTFYSVLFDLNGNIQSNNLIKDVTNLHSLNQRLICLAFDYKNEFTKTPWDDRARHSFDILQN